MRYVSWTCSGLRAERKGPPFERSRSRLGLFILFYFCSYFCDACLWSYGGEISWIYMCRITSAMIDLMIIFGISQLNTDISSLFFGIDIWNLAFCFKDGIRSLMNKEFLNDFHRLPLALPSTKSFIYVPPHIW